MSENNHIKVHPLAASMPPMSETRYKELLASLRLGYKADDPIALYEGKILDGKHRYKGCRELDIEPVTVEFDDGKGETAAEFVFRKAISKELTDTQLALARLELNLDGEVKAAKEREQAGKGEDGSGGRGNKKTLASHDARVNGKPKGKAAAVIAEKAGVGTRTVEKLMYVIKHGTAEEVQAIREGKAKPGTQYKKVKDRVNPSDKKPKKAKQKRGFLWTEYDDPFHVAVKKLKELGRCDKKKFMAVLGKQRDRNWFFGAIKEIPYLEIKEHGDEMELKVRKEEADICTKVMNRLEKAKEVMTHGSKFKFDFDAVDKMIRDLYSLVVLGAKR